MNMIGLLSTNQVNAMTYAKAVSDAAQYGYLHGQVDRLQHEVDMLEIGLLVFVGLLAVTTAALLLFIERHRREGRSAEKMMPPMPKAVGV